MSVPRTNQISTLRRLRENRGWGVRELAKKAGCSPATISRIERGEEMTTANFVGLCRAHGFNELADQIEWLLS